MKIFFGEQCANTDSRSHHARLNCPKSHVVERVREHLEAA